MDKFIERVKKIKALIFGSLYYRYTALLLVSGTALVGGQTIIYKILIMASEKLFGETEYQKKIESAEQISQYFGVTLCVISIILFIYFYKREELQTSRSLANDIIKYWEEGKDFTFEHDAWFDNNPQKEEQFYSIIKDTNTNKSEKLKELRHKWSSK